MLAKNWKQKLIFVLMLELCKATWSTTPGPYYQRFNDGSYNYGYNAGGGFSARQSGTASNEVSGQYAQLLPDGNLVNVRYKAGVGGFRPQLGSSISTTARPYGFAYNTGDAFHQAAGDQSGNVRGNYWYRDPTGTRHDLQYRAGPGLGFVPTGGSLAIPNGLGRRSLVPGYGLTTPRWNGPTGNTFNDGPYGYTDPETGINHDPTYAANGVNSRSPTSGTIGGPASDGSYNFGYRTPDSVRQEGGDGHGNVHGSYAFRNDGGNHDLAFVAGPGIGFQPTGGSLARPNGLVHGAGVGAYGNDGSRIGGSHPALGSSGVGLVEPAYSTGGTENVGSVGVNGGSGLSTVGGGSGTSGHGGTGGHRGTVAGGLGTRGGATDGGSAGTTGGLNSAGANGGGASGIRGGGGGVTNGNSGLGSLGGNGHGLNSAGGSSGIGGLRSSGGSGHNLNLGSSGFGGHGGRSFGSGVSGLGSATDGGHFGHHRPNLNNVNSAAGAFGGQGGYGAGGHGYGNGRGAFASGSSGGLLGSAAGGLAARGELIDDDGGNAKAFRSGSLGGGSSAANHGGLGTGRSSGFGSGVGDHQKLGSGTAGNGGYSYGTSGGSVGSSSGSGASESGGGLQTSGSGLQGSGSSGSSSSSGSSGGVVSGEQHDLQRNTDSVQSLQSIGVSSATKEISS